LIDEFRGLKNSIFDVLQVDIGLMVKKSEACPLKVVEEGGTNEVQTGTIVVQTIELFFNSKFHLGDSHISCPLSRTNEKK
jgi:hypothetical protein